MNLSFWLREYIRYGKEPNIYHGQSLSEKFGYLKRRLPTEEELDALTPLYRWAWDKEATALSVLFYRLAKEWEKKDPLLGEVFKWEIREEDIRELLTPYRRSLLKAVLEAGKGVGLFEKNNNVWKKTGELPTPAVYLILQELSKEKEPWGEYYSFTVKELAEEVFLPLFGIGEWELSRKIRGLQAHRLIDAEIRADLDNVFLPTEAIC